MRKFKVRWWWTADEGKRRMTAETAVLKGDCGISIRYCRHNSHKPFNGLTCGQGLRQTVDGFVAEFQEQPGLFANEEDV